MKKFVNISAKILSVLAILFKINSIIKKKSDLSLKDNYHSKSDFIFESTYGKIRYKHIGKTDEYKPKILLVHSLMNGGSLEEFNYLSKMLASSFEVYAIDMLGFGHSDKPNISYSSYLYVSLLKEFITNEMGGSASILASSMSADFALMLREMDESLVEELFLVNPKGIGFSKKYGSICTKMLKAFVSLPIIGTFFSNVISSKYFIKRMLLDKFYYNPTVVTKELVDSFYNNAHFNVENNKYALAHLYSKFLDLDTLDILKSTTLKTTIILGENNRYYDSYIAKAALDENDNVKTYIIPLSKNLLASERPFELRSIVIDRI